MTRFEVLRNEKKEIVNKLEKLEKTGEHEQEIDNLKIRRDQLEAEIKAIEDVENHNDKTEEVMVKDKSKIYRLAEKASIIGDTVGDPLKDTSGPSLNILIKLSSILSLVFGSLFVSTSYLI
jgi:DNA repair ATPase RecN